MPSPQVLLKVCPCGLIVPPISSTLVPCLVFRPMVNTEVHISFFPGVFLLAPVDLNLLPDYYFFVSFITSLLLTVFSQFIPIPLLSLGLLM